MHSRLVSGRYPELIPTVQAMFGNEAFRVFLINTFTTNSLFVGCSLTDLDLLSFLDALTFHLKGNLGGAHFAFMRTQGTNPIKRRNFEESWGIRIIGDGARADYQNIPGLLHLLKAVPRATPPAPAVLRASFPSRR